MKLFEAELSGQPRQNGDWLRHQGVRGGHEGLQTALQGMIDFSYRLKINWYFVIVDGLSKAWIYVLQSHSNSKPFSSVPSPTAAKSTSLSLKCTHTSTHIRYAHLTMYYSHGYQTIFFSKNNQKHPWPQMFAPQSMKRGWHWNAPEWLKHSI